MWVNQPKLNKHIFIDNPDFDLIHFVEDCYRNTDEPNQLLFEFDDSWYIATISDSSEMRFDNSFRYILNAGPFGIFYMTVSKQLGEWVGIAGYTLEGIEWKAILNQYGDFSTTHLVRGNYKLNTLDNKFEPFPIATGSEDLSDFIEDFTRHGLNVYKSGTLLGSYEWQGISPESDIVVGYRKYTHKALDDEGQPTSEDIQITESVELTQTNSIWSYTYLSKTYIYTGDLPLNTFNMTSGDDTLSMTYTGLTQLNKDIIIFDGGAQIVD